MGDRDVYFVTSLEGDGDLYGKDDARLDEPQQDLNHINSEYKQNFLTESTTYTTNNRYGDNDGLDVHPLLENNQNDISVETSTMGHRRFHLPGRNGANYISQSIFCLIVSFYPISWVWFRFEFQHE